MTQQEKRIKIAEACGWVEIIRQDRPLAEDQEKFRFLGRHPHILDTVHRLHYLPDYFNDLNAMHEAEKVLASSQCAAYRDRLSANPSCFDDMIGACIDWELVHATASQRAEALGLTLNLWQQE